MLMFVPHSDEMTGMSPELDRWFLFGMLAALVGVAIYVIWKRFDI